MKRTLLRMACLGLLAMMCTSGRATVFTGNCGASSVGDKPASTATWSFNSDTGELTITGEGALYDYSGSQIPWHAEDGKDMDPNDGFFIALKSVVIGNGITTIPGGYFYMEKALTTVTLPSTLTSIGLDAFAECLGLKTITVSATTPPALGVYGDGSEAPMPESVFYQNDNSDPESLAVQINIATLEKIIVPSAEAVTAYQQADGWKKYKDIIQVATVEKKDPVVTIKAAEGLVYKYNSEAQELLAQAETSGGTLWFYTSINKLDNVAELASEWIESIPKGTNAGTYYVYYEVAGDDETKDLPAKKDQYVKVTISPRDLPGAKPATQFITTPVTLANGQRVNFYYVSSLIDYDVLLEAGKDFIVTYQFENGDPTEFSKDEFIAKLHGCVEGSYNAVIRGIGNYTGILNKSRNCGSPTNYRKNANGTAKITGAAETAKQENEAIFVVPKYVNDENGTELPVTGIASGAFPEGMDILIQILNKTKLIIEKGAIGKGNSVQVDPELLDEYAEDPNLLETLKSGNLFAELAANYELQTFSSRTALTIPAVKKLVVLSMDLGTFNIADFLQVFTCSVDKGVVEATPIMEKMKDKDGNYHLKPNNGVLIGCNIKKFEESVKAIYNNTAGLSALITLDDFQKFAKSQVATLIAQFTDEKNAAEGIANDYENNMLIPVPKDMNFKSDPDYTYYILYENAFHAILDNESTTPKGKAVLKVPTSKASGTRTLDITIGDDGTTAIQKAPALGEEPGLDRWYNLNGQRISQPDKKGLYIHNGRKVVIN